MSVETSVPVFSNSKNSVKQEDPFHQQLGYRLRGSTAKLVMHSFMIPRGMTVLLGGPAEAEQDTEIQIKGQSATFHHVDKNRLERTKSSVLTHRAE